MLSTSSNGRPVLRSSEEENVWLSLVIFGGIRIDLLLLFWRLTTVMQSSDDLELAFKHELCSYPPALIDYFLLLHEADKPALADAI